MRFQTYSHLWYPSGNPRAQAPLVGVCPLGTLWYPSGDPRAQAPLVGVCPLGTLWSDALWAPYSLSELKFYYEIFYPARDPEGEGCARPRGAQNELLKIFLQDPSPIGSWTTLAGSEYLGPTGHGRYYLFSTHSFPLGDQEILIKALSNRLRVGPRKHHINASTRSGYAPIGHKVFHTKRVAKPHICTARISTAKGVIVGTLSALGDACLRLRLTLRIGKSRDGNLYCVSNSILPIYWNLYDLFDHFVGAPPQVKNIRGGGARDRQSIWFKTYGINFMETFYIQPIHTFDEGRTTKALAVLRTLSGRSLRDKTSLAAQQGAQLTRPPGEGVSTHNPNTVRVVFVRRCELRAMHARKVPSGPQVQGRTRSGFLKIFTNEC